MAIHEAKHTLKEISRYAFVVLLAVSPVVKLGASNVREISISAQLRPATALILLTIGLSFLTYKLVKDRDRAAIFAALFVFLFFSYSHFLNANGADKFPYIHWLLWAGLIVIPLAGQWAAKKSETLSKAIITALNVLGTVMIAQSAYTMAAYPLSMAKAASGTPIEFSGGSATQPDVYYIILDAYTRADTLETQGFDNSDFIGALESRGFYVAQCSTSNYRFTTLSLSSALNMDYPWDFIPHKNENDANSLPIDKSIKQNRVRDIFESMGYRTIAFQTGFLWTEWHDADLYLQPDYHIVIAPDIQPFERLLVYISAIRPFLDDRSLGVGLGDIFAYQAHITRINFTLKTLAELPSINGPKFVFAHVLIPHPPYVFLPDGSINKNGAYFDLPNALSTDGELNQMGYFNNIKTINIRILNVIDMILAGSTTPPIIIIQGDHGSWNSDGLDKFTILNAYFLPPSNGNELDGIYPRITPVNSFRMIFNRYFGTHYPLLDDLNILSDIGRPYKNRPAPPIPSPCD